MSDTPRCPECGVRLPEDAPEGLCPQCLVAAGLECEPAASSGAATSDYQPLSAAKVGTRVGHFKLLQQIGEGGFGVVYMAEQTAPVRRKVALKIIKPGMDTKQVIARFEAERQALALMDHPNIASVLDAGSTDEGRPFFVMELVRGVPITEFCDDNGLATNERLELFITICNAIQHAHQKGVIHRDIKPSNVMVTLHDGVPVPKVIDFGVAKATQQQLTERTMFTAYGEMIGTPQYMSPEQAEMSGLDIDTRSDIFSLGVLLYELLTGSPPLDSERLRSAGYAEVQRMIREEEPHKPSTRISTLGQATAKVASHRGTDAKKLAALLRGDLDWIVMRALEKNRNRRYETANGLALDVRRHLSNEPVVARPPSAMYRLSKLARRNKAAVAAMAGIIGALAAGLAVATWGYLEADYQRGISRTAQTAAEHDRDAAREAQEQAETEKLRAESAEAIAKEQARELGKQVYTINFVRAQEAFAEDKFFDVQRRLDACPPQHRSWEWRRLKHLSLGSGWMIHTGSDRIWWMAIGPNRQRVVTAHAINHPKLQGVLTMIDASSGEILWQNLDAHTDECNGVSFSHDGKLLVSAADDGRVRLWESATGRHIRDLEGFPPGASIIHAAFSPDDRLVVGGGGGIRQRAAGDHRIRVWQTDTGKMVGELEGHTGKVRRMVFSHDGERLYSCDHAGQVIAWEVADLRLIYRTTVEKGEDQYFHCVALSPDGTTLATAGYNGQVKLWQAEDGAPIRTLGEVERMAMTVAFSADGQRIAAGGRRDLQIWEVDSGSHLAAIKGHAGLVRGLAFTADSDVVISADEAGYAKRSHLDEQEVNHGVELPIVPGVTEAADFSDDGKWLVTGDHHGALILWNADTLESVQRIDGRPGGRISSASLSPDGQLITAGTIEGKVRLFDSLTGQLLWTADHGTRGQLYVAFSPDGESLVSAGDDGIVICWDVRTGESRVRRLLHPAPITGLKACAAGLFATSSHQFGELPLRFVVFDASLSTIRQWDIPAGTLAFYHALALSSDGRQIAYSAYDRIYVAAVHNKSVETRLRSPRNVHDLAFGAQGRRLFSFHHSSNVHLWDIDAQEEVYQFQGAPEEVSLLAINPSNDQILLSAYERTGPRIVLIETAPPKNQQQRRATIEAHEWLYENRHRTTPSGFGFKADVMSAIAHDTTLEDPLRSTVLRIAPPITPPFVGDGRVVATMLYKPQISQTTRERARKWADAASESTNVELLIRLALGFASVGQQDAADDSLKKASTLDPGRVARLYHTQGIESAQADRWSEAADLFTRAIALEPDDHEMWRFHGYALLAAGDEQGYIQHCQTMFVRFGHSKDPTILRRNARLFAASAGWLPQEQLKTIATQITQAATEAPTHSDIMWLRLASGMATYRAGQFADAVPWLEINTDHINFLGAATSLFYLAMAQHQLANDAAPETLREAVTIMDAASQSEKFDQWHDWLVCRLARSEAEALIHGESDEEAESLTTERRAGDE
ncbi:MAG: protein kinase domain-containing protein [Aeoliella sp.]